MCVLQPVPTPAMKRARTPSPPPQYKNKKQATAAHYAPVSQGEFSEFISQMFSIEYNRVLLKFLIHLSKGEVSIRR